MQIDLQDFRRALGAFVTGVTVVTTSVDGKPVGFTANSFTSVSLDPPLILVCIGKSSSNFEIFSKIENFAVNILSEKQRDVSRTFATKGIDRFASVEWQPAVLGNPILPDSAAWFECGMHQRIDAGDHIILIGNVKSYGHDTVSPLGYCRGNYVMFQLEQEVLAPHSPKTSVGAIIEAPSGIILVPSSTPGRWMLPRSHRIGSKEGNDGLHGVLNGLGLSFDIDFLFSVYDDDASHTLNIYYRGTSDTAPEGQAQVFDLQSIPYDLIEDEAVRALLRRYVDERLEFRFSVYSGDTKKGRYWTAASNADARVSNAAAS